MRINFYRSLLIFLHLFLLALSLRLFFFGVDLVVGGIDGLCIVLGKYFFFLKPTTEIYNYNLYCLLNVTALFLCFFQEKLSVFLKTSVIVMVLLLQLKILSCLPFDLNVYLSTIFIPVTNFTGIPTSTLQLGYACFFGGLGCGISLGYIRHYGYTTGGMDIYQKFLKNYFQLSFTQALFLTDGIIIFLAFLKDYDDNKVFHQAVIERLLLPYCTLVIIGYLMQKIVSTDCSIIE